MDFDTMTDGQILIELRRHLAFCEAAKIELARRANGDDNEPRRCGILPGNTSSSTTRFMPLNLETV